MLLIAATQVAPRAATSSSSWSGCFWVWVGRELLCWPVVLGVKEGCSSIRAIPAGAWEESTWSTRSTASMNDVDPDEH